MTHYQFAIGYLKAVEKKHKDYFISAKLHISSCVEIKGEDVVTVHIINDLLPPEIRYDIEEMFWKD